MRLLIVDDEKPARDRLRQLLADVDRHEIVGEAGTGAEALSLASEKRPDVVLLDIRMPGMSGIETAHHLNALTDPPAVVFATAYDEYAIDAFEARAAGYVLKPVRRERLLDALDQASRLKSATLNDIAARARMEPARRHVCSRLHDQLKLIPIENIQYFRADQKYVCVQHSNGQDLIDDSLKSLEEEFADEFVRIHRSIVVAVGKIAGLEKTRDGKYRVVLRGGSRGDDQDLIISRRHLTDVRRRLKRS